jgi:DNA polymerase-3 subunit delta
MRMCPEQLKSHLQKGLQPLYTLHGEEPFQILEAGDAIRAAAYASGYTEREVYNVDTHFKWDALKASSGALSLFGTHKVVEIRVLSGKVNAEGAQALMDYCAALPPDTLTLVSLPVKLDQKTQTGDWYKSLEKNGVCIAVFPVDRAGMPQWIKQRLEAQGQQVDAEALELLADRVEGNLFAAHQEMQKLSLLYPPGALSLDQVKSVVADVARFDVFKLADAVLGGDVVRIPRMLNGLREEGVDPVLILWALAKEIRTLLAVHNQMHQGASLAQALQEAKVWAARRALTERALSRVSEARAVQGLKRAAAIDRLIKGLGVGDVWDEFLQLILLMAKPKREKARIAA